MTQGLWSPPVPCICAGVVSRLRELTMLDNCPAERENIYHTFINTNLSIHWEAYVQQCVHLTWARWLRKVAQEWQGYQRLTCVPYVLIIFSQVIHFSPVLNLF